MNNFKYFLAFILVFSPFTLAQTREILGPVVTVGHGGMYDADGKEITPTANFILKTQNTYRTQLIDQLPPEKHNFYTSKLDQLRAEQFSKSDQVQMNAEVISKLIDEVKPSNAAHLSVVNAVLKNKYGQSLIKRPGHIEKFEPSVRLLKALKKQGFDTITTTALETSLSGQAYIDQCRSQGVPIPPDWGDPQWQFRGNLNTKFIIKNQVAAVWTFVGSNPRGICFGLPRFPANSSSSDAFGIICQGNETSKACFWDADGIPLSGITPLLRWKGGEALLGGNGVCTDCHAGENPFIVHPGTPLDQGSILKPDSWMKPLVHTSWPQNQGPTTLLDDIALEPNERSCLACHNASGSRFPEASTDLPGYCKIILAQAFSTGGTMPPGNAGNTAYLKHVSALKEACKQRPKMPPASSKKQSLIPLFHLLLD